MASDDHSGRAEQTERRKSYGDAATASLMVGLGEIYLPAFGLSLGLSEISTGLLASLPLLAGGILQLFGPRLAYRIGSPKTWVLLCARTQIVVFALLASMAAVPGIPASLVFLLAACYWGAGLGAAPSWNNWIERIISRPLMTPFLAQRARIAQMSSFAAFFGAGLWLHHCHTKGLEKIGFFSLFLAAALARSASLLFLKAQKDPDLGSPPGTTKEPRLRVRAAMRSFGLAPESRFLWFLIGTQVMVQISGPFYAPYMLSSLKLSYLGYTGLVSVNYAARIASYPIVSRIVARLGVEKALRWGGFCIALSPVMWAVTANYTALALAQIFAGFAWAMYELATTLMFFEKLPAKSRISVMSCYNFFNALAVVVGAGLGSVVMSTVAKEWAYPILFGLSGSGRLSALIILMLIGISLTKQKPKSPQGQKDPTPETPPLADQSRTAMKKAEGF